MLMFRCVSRLGGRQLASRPWVRLSYSTPSAPQKPVPPASPLPAALREKVWTVPNMLTFTRLALAPAIGYFLATDQRWAAMGLFTYLCVTDLADGFIARRYNMGSVLGSIMDPAADKLLMMTCTGALAVSGAMPLPLAAVIIGRDLGLAAAAVVVRYRLLPPPKTWSRYWDVLLPSASVHPTTISKYNTFLQMVYIGAAVMHPALEQVVEALVLADGMLVGGWVVAATTIWSGLLYVFSKTAIRYV